MNSLIEAFFVIGIILSSIAIWGVDNQKIHWESRQAISIFLGVPGFVLIGVGALLFVIKVAIILWRLW